MWCPKVLNKWEVLRNKFDDIWGQGEKVKIGFRVDESIVFKVPGDQKITKLK